MEGRLFRPLACGHGIILSLHTWVCVESAGSMRSDTFTFSRAVKKKWYFFAALHDPAVHPMLSTFGGNGLAWYP